MGLILNDPCIAGANPADQWLSGGSVSYQAGLGRFGRSALRLTGNGQVSKTIPGTPAEFWFGFAFWFSSLQNSEIVAGFDLTANQEQVGIYKTATGQLQFKKGDGTLLATSPDILAVSTWYHCRWHLIIDAVNGLSNFYLNGQSTPWMSFTGNTRRTANNLVNSPRFLNFDEHRFCDIYLLDTVGSPSGDQGDLLISAATITADSATANKNTMNTQPAQAAGAHFNNVDETSPNDTDYNFSSVVGAIERYRITLPSAIAPKWMTARVRVQNDTAGTHNVRPGFAQGAIEVDGPDFSTPSSPAYSPYYCAVNDPGTGNPWTLAGAQSAEVYGKIIT